LIGGRWLGGLLAAAGLVSMWGLFTAQLLYASRLPYVMARDGWLPKVLAKASPKTAVPTVATIVFCAITGVFAALSFGGLAVIQSLMYAGLVVMGGVSLYWLRRRRAGVPVAIEG